MNRHAAGHAEALRCALQRQHRFGIGGKAALVVTQCGLREPCAFIEHGQQRQTDAGGRGRVGQRPGQRARVGIGRAVAVVLQIVKLADLRVAAAQQLDVELRGDVTQRLGLDALRHAVHAVAPRPEIVVRRFAPLGQAGEGALKSVAVRVDQAGQRWAGEQGRFGRRRHADLDAQPAAVAIGFEQHRIGPTATHPRARRP
jgi:hypothetical protein